MSREKLVPETGKALHRAVLAAVARHREAGAMTGRDMDACLTFCGVTRRELSRRCRATQKTGFVWSRKGPPPAVSGYVVRMVQHAMAAPPPPEPEEWWTVPPGAPQYRRGPRGKAA